MIIEQNTEISRSNIVDLFHEQANRYREKTVLISDNNLLTYGELDRLSDELASSLRSRNIKANSIISFVLGNGEAVLVSILGILKAGCCYLPLDPSYPEIRIQRILQDSNTSWLIQNEPYVNPGGHVTVLAYDELLQQGSFNSAQKLNVLPQDPAYVMYTSGSTGIAKGVVVEHRSINNFAYFKISKFQFGADDITLQLLSPAFDAYGSNLYPSLFSGGTIVIPNEPARRDVVAILSAIRRYHITTFSLTPSFFREIIQSASSEDMQSVSRIFLGGESLSSEMIEYCKQNFSHIQLYNEYGLTETTITASCTKILPQKINDISNQIDQMKIFLKNGDKQPLVPGKKSEIHISGIGVARGYLNDPQLTHEKFGYGVNQAERIYKTGDYAELKKDGTIVFAGRIDAQIKHNGVRIDLEEIRKTMIRLADTSNIQVLYCENQYQLHAIHVFIATQEQLDVEKIKADLPLYLPPYMIPEKLFIIKELPYGSNGKVDLSYLRKICAQPSEQAEQINELTQTEQYLKSVWESVLKQQNIQTNTNLFDIGGNSMLVMKVHRNLAEKYPQVISITDLFSYPSISKLAGYIDRKLNGQDDRTTNVPSEAETSWQRLTFGFHKTTMALLEMIATKYKISYQDAVSAIIVYLFAKCTGRHSVHLSCGYNMNTELRGYYFRFLEISEFHQLFQQFGMEAVYMPEQAGPTNENQSYCELFIGDKTYFDKLSTCNCYIHANNDGAVLIQYNVNTFTIEEIEDMWKTCDSIVQIIAKELR